MGLVSSRRFRPDRVADGSSSDQNQSAHHTTAAGRWDSLVGSWQNPLDAKAPADSDGVLVLGSCQSGRECFVNLVRRRSLLQAPCELPPSPVCAVETPRVELESHELPSLGGFFAHARIPEEVVRNTASCGVVFTIDSAAAMKCNRNSPRNVAQLRAQMIEFARSDAAARVPIVVALFNAYPNERKALKFACQELKLSALAKRVCAPLLCLVIRESENVAKQFDFTSRRSSAESVRRAVSWLQNPLRRFRSSYDDFSDILRDWLHQQQSDSDTETDKKSRFSAKLDVVLSLVADFAEGEASQFCQFRHDGTMRFSTLSAQTRHRHAFAVAVGAEDY
ncbi:MAG: hypothetical protein MHM6MM_002422 [Cercozoa sp. M6MM]